MVQFNLLPDVKLEYLKAQRTKRSVMMASISLTSLAVFVLILLFLIVNVFQKQHISNLDDDIQSKISQLEAVEDLDRVLTVQNQLNSLTQLHEGRPAASRLYDYLVQLTPQDAKISEVSVDFAANSITISGSAGSLETVNRFTDILKFTEYSDGELSERAFSGVVLSEFGVEQGGNSSHGRTSYSIQFAYQPAIFDNTKTVSLQVPSIISTRSVVETPTDLFEAKPPEEESRLQGE